MTDKEHGKKFLATIRDYKSCFNSEAGKRVLWDMMKAHNMTSSTFDPNNIYETVFREGARNTVLRILSKINIDAKLLEDQIRRNS